MACILIIDDEPAFRAVVREMLEGAGYTVVEACNGHEGLDQCQTYPVDLVLADLIMPVLDGFALIPMLKTPHPTIRIIVLSGGGLTQHENVLGIAERLGAHRALHKPMRRQELLEAVRAVLAMPSHA